jgi:hypothetical protein
VLFVIFFLERLVSCAVPVRKLKARMGPNKHARTEGTLHLVSHEGNQPGSDVAPGEVASTSRVTSTALGWFVAIRGSARDSVDFASGQCRRNHTFRVFAEEPE